METRAASNGIFPPLLILTAFPALPTGVCRLSGALPPPLRVPVPSSCEIFQQFSTDRVRRDEAIVNCRVETNWSSDNHTGGYLSQFIVFNMRHSIINLNERTFLNNRYLLYNTDKHKEAELVYHY